VLAEDELVVRQRLDPDGLDVAQCVDLLSRWKFNNHKNRCIRVGVQTSETSEHTEFQMLDLWSLWTRVKARKVVKALVIMCGDMGGSMIVAYLH
jgi:hypothetical protein